MEHRFDILERQEQLLRFDRFCQCDALALGNLMAQRAQKAGLTVAISIRLANGVILFQYLPDGTNALNEKRRPPLTTFATRFIKTTFSSNSGVSVSFRGIKSTSLA